MSNGKNTRKKSSEQELRMESLTKHQSTLTCASLWSPVQLDNIEDISTWLAGASHVSRSQLQESEKAIKTSEICGLPRSESFAKYDPDSASWRTSGDFFPSMTEHTSVEYSGNFPKQGMMRDGVCYQLEIAAHRTSANGSGLWLTPRASDTGIAESVEAFQKRMNTKKGCSRGEACAGSLSSQVASPKTWPTPDANMGNRGTQPEWKPKRESGHPASYKINQAVRDRGKPTQQKGQLNPDWVEWLMGWPIGWTDLKPLGMDKFHWWRQLHGKS